MIEPGALEIDVGCPAPPRRLAPAAEVTGTVRYADGAPAAGATVAVRSPDDRSGTPRT